MLFMQFLCNDVYYSCDIYTHKDSALHSIELEFCFGIKIAQFSGGYNAKNKNKSTAARGLHLHYRKLSTFLVFVPLIQQRGYFSAISECFCSIFAYSVSLLIIHSLHRICIQI